MGRAPCEFAGRREQLRVCVLCAGVLATRSRQGKPTELGVEHSIPTNHNDVAEIIEGAEESGDKFCRCEWSRWAHQLKTRVTWRWNKTRMASGAQISLA